MKNLFAFLILTFAFTTTHFGQDAATATTASATIQPTIMAIPFARENQSLRGNYERNELVRIAITKVKDGFDQRGVNTIDFRAKLKQVSNNEVLTEDQQSSMKDDLISLSGADIYVEVEANPNRSNTGNSVTIIMTAYDAVSGESLANKVSNSPKFYTDNYEKLVEKAVEAEIENLLNTIQEKFNDIRENGRTVVLTVGVDIDADFDLDEETAEGDLLSEAIEDWVADNSLKGYYHMQGSTETKIIFDIVKIPLKDDKGRSYRVSKLASKLRNHLKKQGFAASRTIQGNNVVMTLSTLE